jgi:hypothetical protein
MLFLDTVPFPPIPAVVIVSEWRNEVHSFCSQAGIRWFLIWSLVENSGTVTYIVHNCKGTGTQVW